MLKLCVKELPSLSDIHEALESVKGRFIEFDYDTICPPKPNTPSVVSQKEDTKSIPPPQRAKGFAVPNGTDALVWVTKQNNVVIRFLSMHRRKEKPTGEGYFSKSIPSSPGGKEQGEYLWRTYRAEGIRLASFLVADGSRGKVRLFPAVTVR